MARIIPLEGIIYFMVNKKICHLDIFTKGFLGPDVSRQPKLKAGAEPVSLGSLSHSG
jgi:hypothetical protein